MIVVKIKDLLHVIRTATYPIKNAKDQRLGLLFPLKRKWNARIDGVQVALQMLRGVILSLGWFHWLQLKASIVIGPLWSMLNKNCDSNGIIDQLKAKFHWIDQLFVISVAFDRSIELINGYKQIYNCQWQFYQIFTTCVNCRSKYDWDKYER